MKSSDVLKAAKGLISTPERWTKGYVAKTKSGRPIPAGHPDAVCFCMLGALIKVSEGQDYLLSELLEKWILDYNADENTTYADVTYFNDDKKTTHADVMAAFDRIIKLAEEQEE